MPAKTEASACFLAQTRFPYFRGGTKNRCQNTRKRKTARLCVRELGVCASNHVQPAEKSTACALACLSFTLSRFTYARSGQIRLLCVIASLLSSLPPFPRRYCIKFYSSVLVHSEIYTLAAKYYNNRAQSSQFTTSSSLPSWPRQLLCWLARVCAVYSRATAKSRLCFPLLGIPVDRSCLVFAELLGRAFASLRPSSQVSLARLLCMAEGLFRKLENERKLSPTEKADAS